MSCKLNRPFTVTVEGNIASGKSTFLGYLARFPEICTVYVSGDYEHGRFLIFLQEPLEKWCDVEGSNLLDLLYQNIDRNGYLFHHYIQLTRLQMHMQETAKPIRILERSLHSSYCIEFVESFNVYYKHIPTVYLQTSPEVVYTRLQSRSRPEERDIPMEYLVDVHKTHEDWLVMRSHGTIPCPVIVLDASKPVNELVNSEYPKIKDIIWRKAMSCDDIAC
ncbi:unnamed protein product [Darwinula stevensoni]|uniref:Deoxynucleoside kinase domain-containing protein n=1 Tax=Darwinula stevensoni TaxID=69355 RepID=A0A7R9A9C3_9CRUS|nr:unnamed protein product [Darwinula stevensoni]CAG0897294.1 unnamed protein product [Darwinula stevensoni]